MKKLAIISFLFLFACSNKPANFKYKITGFVKSTDSTHNAIWYTDDFEWLNHDTIFYHNSNGSLVKIGSPFAIDTLK